MGKFDGILICTDLDGTLYKNDKTISAENKSAIEYFKNEGGYFTFITGRIAAGAKIVNDIIKANAPCGCVNGGGIYDYRTEKLLWYCFFIFVCMLFACHSERSVAKSNFRGSKPMAE